jgi:mannose-6-phosphate isomerase-like protein (cupin superfamily)
MKHSWHATTGEAQAAPIPEGRRSAQILRHGSLELRWYAPRGEDPQTPHERDELYVIAAGRAAFVRGAERVQVAAHDVLFVPAGMPHRFEEMSADFATWVMFYGATGGERELPFFAGNPPNAMP